MVKAPSPGASLRGRTRKIQSNDFPGHYLYFGRQKVIILGAARQGETLAYENESAAVRRESLPGMGAA
jgi:hypothetical protein